MTTTTMEQTDRHDDPDRRAGESTGRRPLNIGIVLGSTRPGRNGEAVARWAHEIAQRRTDAAFELVDIAEYALPLLDEAMPPIVGEYAHQHTRAWAETIRSFDAYVFVTPEYNHATSGTLKNAIDFLYAEWNDKVAGFVGYGAEGGIRAIEHLRLVLAELKIASVRTHAALSIHEDFREFTTFEPRPDREASVTAMLDEVVQWAGALRIVRTDAAAVAGS